MNDKAGPETQIAAEIAPPKQKDYVFSGLQRHGSIDQRTLTGGEHFHEPPDGEFFSS